MRVPGVMPTLGQSLRRQLGAQGQVLQVRVVAAAAVHHQGAVLQANGRQRGARRCVGVLRVKRQRISSTEHKGHTLTNRYRLKQFDHVGVRGAEHTDVIDVDDDIT